MKRICFAFLLVIVGQFSMAQRTVYSTSVNQEFHQALDLFEKEKYAASRNSFEQILKNGIDPTKVSDARYYQALSALRLFNDDAESLIKRYTKDYKGTSNSHDLQYELGSHFYNQKSYNKAIEQLSQVDFKKLSMKKKRDGRFRLGYSYFMQKDFQNALSHLEFAKSGRHQYSYAAYFYSGYIHFRNGNFRQAFSDFEMAEGHKAYKNLVPYMKVNMYQRQHKWSMLTTYADSVLANNRKVANSDVIYLLAAEGHFREDNYEKSARYFTNYGKRRRLSTEIEYRLAYSNWKTGKIDEAIAGFKKVALTKDSLGQHAAYYLGLNYISKGNKELAYGAFQQAARMDHDKHIAQQASLDVAKIAMELGRYNESITILRNLLNDNPEQDVKAEADVLLPSLYLKTNNYSDALNYIDGLRYKSVDVKKVYQRVAYFRATELYNQEKYSASLNTFRKSRKYPYNKELEGNAFFWEGEIYALQNDWDKALSSYGQVKRSKADKVYKAKSDYGIGYCYYNKSEYVKAEKSFKAFQKSSIKDIQKSMVADVEIRLGDCAYKRRSFQTAVGHYDNAVKKSKVNVDYALYQKSIIYGRYLDNKDIAISGLEILKNRFKDSPYLDDAMFYQSEMYLESAKYNEAISGFSQLLSRSKGSPYDAAALKSRALGYENLKQFEKAIKDYDRLILRYCGCNEAKIALKSLPVLLEQTGDAEGMEKRLNKYSACNPGSDDVAELRYKIVKRAFYDAQDFNKVIEKGQKFITEFPGNKDVKDVRFFIAESYYAKEDFDNALINYNELIKDPAFPFFTKALDRSGEISMKSEDYQGAIKSYSLLFKYADSKRKQLHAMLGLTEAFYETGRFDSSKVYANETLKRLNSVPYARNNAKLYIGKCDLAKGDTSIAIVTLHELSSKETDEFAAEAKYLIAKIRYDQTNYRASLDTCYVINKSFASHLRWVGESFLLIAENFVKKEELNQAKETLHSLNKFPDEFIVKKAAARLEELEKNIEEVIEEEEKIFEPEEDDSDEDE